MLASCFCRQWRYLQGAAFPINLVLVRNGTSEGVVAVRKLKDGQGGKGDPTLLDRFLARHSSKWRLTQSGLRQAQAAGRWLDENFPEGFDVHLTGEYIRSLETATNLGLPGVRWRKSLYLRSRDLGMMWEFRSPTESPNVQQVWAEKDRDRYYWQPPMGESIAHLALRTERVLHWVRHHVPANGSALIVTHRDVMESVRIAIEKISPLDYAKQIEAPPPDLAIKHGSVLQYTRRNPTTGEVVPNYAWFSIVTPWHEAAPRPVWHGLYTKHNGSQELLAEVSDFRHLFEPGVYRRFDKEVEEETGQD
jgi:broad specificity phosphatase PhoE